MADVNFYSLKRDLQGVALKNAMTYFKKNKSSIYSKVFKTEMKAVPDVNASFVPENWSDSNWRWFLDNNFLL